MLYAAMRLETKASKPLNRLRLYPSPIHAASFAHRHRLMPRRLPTPRSSRAQVVPLRPGDGVRPLGPEHGEREE